jgi:stress response protein SCP2
MSISLRKGQKVDLTKTNPSITNVIVGLGWDVNKYDGTFPFDLDAAAFMLGENGKVTCDEDFIFYNNPQDRADSVIHQGDNLTGEGDGDDEQVKIDLNKVPADIHKIAFTVTIHEATQRNQNFGQVSNAFIRVVNESSNEELIRYDLGEDFSIETAVVVGELYRYNGEWKFAAIGSGFSDGLKDLCTNFGIDTEDEEAEVQVVNNEPVIESVQNEVSLTKIDLLKKKVDVVLEKKKLNKVVAKVGLVLDISGSMIRLYRNGTVQKVVERILAIASRFDDDGKLDMWMYDHRFRRLPSVTEKDFEDYINREILNKFSRKELFGRNHEAPVMKDVVSKYTNEEPSKYPAFIVFISDGGVRRGKDMKNIIIDSSKHPIFWQFVGIGRSNYGILKELDALTNRYVDNANFFELDDVDKVSDEELYDRLLNEFPSWINEAKTKGII